MVEGALSITHEPEVAAPPALEIPDFEIVPRLGVVFAAIAAVAIVVVIAINKLWPLVFMHVSFGAAWTIIDLFLGFVLGPIMGAMPPPARIQFVTRLMPKMVVIMPIVVSVTLAIGWQLASHEGTVLTTYPHHGWIVASFIVVGVMAVLALGLLEPANIAVLFELKKRQPRPEVIERLMKRFMYCAGVLGAMQVATLVIMTRIASFP
jgi:hypothetical protein